ncbi:MAG TPA: hypothetical protein VHB30_04555, partial [Solirubrobacteraceae bacterium]|nr:hypothetical protein [Solirubrobacteraceae bacterium]
LALGAGILVRPDFLVLAPTTAVVTAAVAWTSVRERLAATALLVATVAVVVAPWSVVATRAAGRLVLPTTSGASSFWVGTYLPSDGSTRRARALLAPDVHERFPDTYRDALPLGVDLMRTVADWRPELDDGESIQRATMANLRVYALGHPLAFARMQLRKVWRMWSRPYQGHNRTRTWWKEALHVPGALAAALVVAAALVLRRRSPVVALVAAILVVGTAFNALAAVQPRANARFVPLALLGVAVAATHVRPAPRSGR